MNESSETNNTRLSKSEELSVPISMYKKEHSYPHLSVRSNNCDTAFKSKRHVCSQNIATNVH